ncbi:MAG TPA: MoaD/ThiS family protein [Sphingobacteriaceae bacterium]
MAIRVILFGQLVEKIGKSDLELEGIRDTDHLEKELHSGFPALGTLSYRIAVEKKLIHENTALKEGMTVALLPPFSGG